MTHIEDNVLVIAEEEPRKCEYCGEVKQTRPYGPNQEHICFDCAHATPEMEQITMENAKERMNQLINQIEGKTNDN